MLAKMHFFYELCNMMSKFISRIYKFVSWKGWEQLDEKMNRFLEQSIENEPLRQTIFCSRDCTKSMLQIIVNLLKISGKTRNFNHKALQEFLQENYSRSKIQRLSQTARQLMTGELFVPQQQACKRISTSMRYASKLHFQYLLYALLCVDKELTIREIEFVQTIGKHIGINPKGQKAVQQKFNNFLPPAFRHRYASAPPHNVPPRLKEAFNLLEIPVAASENDIKKAFRKLAMKYHPDKLMHLSDVERFEAEQTYRRIAAAYQIIKQARGMK